MRRSDEANAAAMLSVYPVTWFDAAGDEHNTWSRNHFTNEVQPDLDGDPLYTTTPPGGETE